MTSAVDGNPLLGQADFAVDLGLVLAVDCSSSVDAGDYKLQLEGIAAALRHPALYRVIAAGIHHRIVFSLLLWSTARNQVIALPWTLLQTQADLERAAHRIEIAPRQARPGGTGLAAAIDFSSAMLATLPVPAERHTIDVSGDGTDNEGGNPAAARDRALARGITINGLPIMNGSALLAEYYRRQVIGGPGNFLEPTRNTLSFKETILRKLLREIGREVA